MSSKKIKTALIALCILSFTVAVNAQTLISIRNVMNSESGTLEFCFKAPENLEKYTRRFNSFGEVCLLNPDEKNRDLKKPISIIFFSRNKQKQLCTMAYVRDKDANLKRLGKGGLAKGDNQWHHFAITWDKGTVDTYLDGKKLQSIKDFPFAFSLGYQLRMGRLHLPIDEVRISNIARSPETFKVSDKPLEVDEHTTLLMDMEPAAGKKGSMKIKYCSDAKADKEISSKPGYFVTGVHGKAVQHIKGK